MVDSEIQRGKKTPVNSENLELFLAEEFRNIDINVTKNYAISMKKRSLFLIDCKESFDADVVEDVKQIFFAATGETLTIDLIGNRGGHSYLAYGLLNYLVPEYSSLRLVYEPMDGRTTKPLQTFATTFSFFSDSILDLRNFSSFTNMECMEPYINYARQYWIKNGTNTKHFESIYVLTNGSCDSACSLFLSKLKYASDFKKIYGIRGGYYNDDDQFESSSYADSGAFKWNEIVQYHNQINSDSSSIDYLPTSAYLNLNVFQLYINALNRDYPREFLKQSIDRRLSSGDYFNIDQSLEKVIYDDIQSNGNKLVVHSLIKITIFNLFVIIFLINCNK
ncbi:unnamed protein product [Rotaria sp. Silwood2]|nr:unnamed protein product [Rotaria sp. Silwood2]CAF3882003.1 unnamed protein product [Rotaria sp. Silwood2]CAF4399273.1 unnamed protein product [Rotaria sp. Silwood2]